jgi:hypothetical protein
MYVYRNELPLYFRSSLFAMFRPLSKQASYGLERAGNLVILSLTFKYLEISPLYVLGAGSLRCFPLSKPASYDLERAGNLVIPSLCI